MSPWRAYVKPKKKDVMMMLDFIGILLFGKKFAYGFHKSCHVKEFNFNFVFI